MHRVLILGIGNTLLQDEGVGIHTVSDLRSRYGDLPGVTYLDGGTLSFTLADAIAESEALIVIDAAELNAAPGVVRCFSGEDMDHYLGTAKKSVHEIGLADLMDIARLTGTLPEHRALIGIQPSAMTWGEYLSEAVASSVPRASAMAYELVTQWRSESGSEH